MVPRGVAQVLDEYAASMTGGQVVPTTTSEGFAIVVILFPNSCDAREAWVSVEYEQLEGVTGLHIHRGQPGSNGERLATLIDGYFESGIAVETEVDPSICEDVWAENFYGVISTSSYPDGELRGHFEHTYQPVEHTAWGAIKARFQ
jgi:hypothetical protein